MIKNACFVINDGPQIWAIRDVDESQLCWLYELAKDIPNSYVTEKVISPNEGVHYGVFSCKAFRDLLRDLGYADAIVRTDNKYRAKV